MPAFELTNSQRLYFGLHPISDTWDRVLLAADKYRPESVLYFEGNIIKRHIISTQDTYAEVHFNELTLDRKMLCPKTSKGKEKKLTAANLERVQPEGVYLRIAVGHLMIASFDTLTTFYSTQWHKEQQQLATPQQLISAFIEQSPPAYLQQIEAFKEGQRKNIKFNVGDYFSFKLNRTQFGFGRILLDVYKLCKKNVIPEGHGLRYIMARPVIIELFAYMSASNTADLALLDSQPKLPADQMMDNHLFYGEFEIIGHREIANEEFDFPISYGKHIGGSPTVFLQWGLIHKELPIASYSKHLGEYKNANSLTNPYGHYSIGMSPAYDSVDVLNAIENNGIFDFSQSPHYVAKYDLRNPANKSIKEELFHSFGLDPHLSYHANSELSGTMPVSELIKQLQ